MFSLKTVDRLLKAICNLSRLIIKDLQKIYQSVKHIASVHMHHRYMYAVFQSKHKSPQSGIIEDALVS